MNRHDQTRSDDSPTPAGPLHMVQARLDPRQLADLGRREGLPGHQDDDDYLVHALLAALFGEGVVQPFRVMGTGSSVSVLGYSDLGRDALREHADAFAEPADHAACDWSGFAVKTLPETWPEDRRLGLEIRVCPVVRLSKEIEVRSRDGDSRTFRRGAELDAWIHHNFKVRADDPAADDDATASRSEVYRDWLARRFEGVAALDGVSLEAFRRARLVRKTHGSRRKARVFERPDALLRGTLSVTDGAAFTERLRRGVGRHTAFGFGMLLLRPAG